MPKFKIIKYYDAIAEYEVDADTREEAEDMVLSGEVDPEEVTVKNSEILDE